MVLVTAAAVAVFGVPLAIAAGRLYRGREVTRLQREATRAAGALPVTGLHGDDPVDLPPASRPVRLAVYDETGRRVAGDGPLTGGREVAAALADRATEVRDGAWLAVAVPMHDEEVVVGAARAALPWSVVAHETQESWLVMGLLGLVAVGLAAGLGWWLSTRLAAPVDGLSGLAVRLGDGDFSARLGPSGVPELDGAADALNRTAERLGHMVERERAFTADVSHQLNTPLTSLRLGLESALLDGGGDDPARRDALGDALGEVDRLQATVATLLAVARDAPLAGGASCDVAAVCAEVVDRCRGALASAGRPLRADVAAGMPRARCPADVLREVLAVLVDNAARHGAGAVTVSARPAGSGVVVEVSDEGPGMAGDPAAVFERRSPEAAGHGIGLALARSLVEAHEGRLELTRASPRPVFTVALPGAR
jgi:signal transduction histidine kinase